MDNNKLFIKLLHDYVHCIGTYALISYPTLCYIKVQCGQNTFSFMIKVFVRSVQIISNGFLSVPIGCSFYYRLKILLDVQYHYVFDTPHLKILRGGYPLLNTVFPVEFLFVDFRYIFGLF